MYQIFEQTLKILNYNVMVHTYSFPNFIIEIATCLVMVFVHFFLITAVNTEIEKLNMPALRIKTKQIAFDLDAKTSVCKDIIKTHSDLGVDFVFKDTTLLSDKTDVTSKIDKILASSFSEYMKRNLKPSTLPIEDTKCEPYQIET